MRSQEDDYIIDIDVVDVHKRAEPSKHYVYELKVKWSNNKIFHVYRRYSEFFDFQNKLLNRFENPDGLEHQRVLPYLPGKIIFGRSHIKAVALERARPIEYYCKSLIQLPVNYSRCNLIGEFFRVNDNDVKDYSNEKSSNTATASSSSSINVIEISRPVQNLKEYSMIESYRSTYDETYVPKAATVVLVHKSLNGWAAVKYNNEVIYVPYAYMKAADVRDTMDDRIILNTPEEYTVTQNYKANRYDEVSLDRGTRVLVLEKNYSGYWKVRVNNTVSVAPSWCMDMNTPIVASSSSNSNQVTTRQPTTVIDMPSKKPKPPRPPPPKPQTPQTSRSNSVVLVNAPTASNLGYFRATETYQSPMLSYASLREGQVVLVVRELNAHEYEIVIDGKTSKAAKYHLEKTS